MATYSVNQAHMQGVIEQMVAVHGRLNDTLDNLTTTAQRSLAGWTSQAQEHYTSHHQQWTASAGNMNGHLARAHQSLGTISEGYRNAEVQGSQMWNQ